MKTSAEKSIKALKKITVDIDLGCKAIVYSNGVLRTNNAKLVDAFLQRVAARTEVKFIEDYEFFDKTVSTYTFYDESVIVSSKTHNRDEYNNNSYEVTTLAKLNECKL